MAKALGATGQLGLLGEINRSAPNRSKISDGGIGDARHAAATSDHNPCKCCRVVTARDFTHDPKNGFDSYQFAEWLRERVLAGEPRVKYVISNRRIYSGQGQPHPAGQWRPYTGKNAHAHHVHVSVRHGGQNYDDDAPWGWSATTTTPTTTRTA
ncbi:MAG TPA: hypothetical protein VKV41_25405 [Methylomirabilota bacterium]|nr:hypothetical protein [Methylomirabilota bacterium]